jgi:hypothetical protein
MDPELLKALITILRIYASLDKLEDELNIAKTLDQLKNITNKIIRKSSSSKANANKIYDRLVRLLLKAERKYVDITTYDLFEVHPLDEPKEN